MNISCYFLRSAYLNRVSSTSHLYEWFFFLLKVNGRYCYMLFRFIADQPLPPLFCFFVFLPPDWLLSAPAVRSSPLRRPRLLISPRGIILNVFCCINHASPFGSSAPDCLQAFCLPVNYSAWASMHSLTAHAWAPFILWLVECGARAANKGRGLHRPFAVCIMKIFWILPACLFLGWLGMLVIRLLSLFSWE